jgi:hypothetical protein
MRRLLSFLIVSVALLAAITLSHAQAVPEARLKAILAMNPQEMAETGAWTRSAYERMLGYIYGIQDKQTRELVLDMVLRPEAKAFNAKATQSFLASPAAGGKGHHYYPGGLPVHALEWIEVAMGWADAYERVYKVKKVNRDMVVAALVLHDWAKVWYEWDPKTGNVVKPQWYPQSWGGERGKAKWKWMGEHGAVVYAEMMLRGAPDSLVVATAASHFDPHWDLDKEGEGLNPALAEAAKIVNKPPIVVTHHKQMAEWWFSTYTDGSWSYSHYIAGHFALGAIELVAGDLGLKAGSLEANKLSWFVLTRVSDFRIYEEYQNANFDMAAAKKLILSVVQDSSAYETAR